MNFRKIGYGAIAVTAVLIGLYPIIYFVLERTFGLLSTKSGGVLNNSIWNGAFYIHIISGGVALLVGWTQFNESFRNRRLKLHRAIGKTYVIAALLSGVAGIHIGFYATGGPIAALGFISLGLIWCYTTIQAFIFIRKGEVNNHKSMMIYSYAACFAAVTLRLWLPLLTVITGEFMLAYTIVSWLCWVPNMVAAYLIVGANRSKSRSGIQQ